MGDALHYGQTISINIPKAIIQKSVTAESDGARRAILAPQGQVGQQKWTILKANDHDSTDPVKFMDLIHLRSTENAGYLSYSSGKNISMSNTSQPMSTETWAILPPDDKLIDKGGKKVSDKEIQAGETVVTLNSMMGPYVSRKGVSDTDPALTCGALLDETSRWVFILSGSPITKALRYGNMISIGRDSKHLAALSTYVKDDPNQNPNDTARAVAFDEVELADSSQWTILAADNLAATGRAKFGDIVCLSASRLRDGTRPSPSSYYLSYRNDHLFSDGHRKIGVVPAVGAWERWQIIDPEQSISLRQFGGREIKFEWTFALKAESGNGEYLSRIAGGGVSTSPTLGDAEKWTAGNVFSEVESKLPNPTPRAQLPDNSAALLSFGSDMAKTVSLGLAKGLSKLLPVGGEVAGGLAGGLIGFLWPANAAIDIWELIKSHVEALVNEKIEDERINAFRRELEGIKVNLKSYAALKTRFRKGGDLDGILRTLERDQIQGIALGAAQRVLPYQVMLGTLHISALQEAYLHGAEYHEDYQDADTDRASLKTKIQEYSELVAQTKQKAFDWRRGLISQADAIWDINEDRGNKKMLRKKIVDTYIKSRGHLAYWDYDFDAAFSRYTEQVVNIFAQQLDDFLLPSLLWRYMDPDCDEVPMKRPGFTVTGPFGLFGEAESDTGSPHYYGDAFFYDPQSGPITEITVSSGDLIDGVQVRSGDQGEWHGAHAGDSTLQMSSDMKIIKAWGRAGWSIDQLWFGSDAAGLFKVKLSVGGGKDGGTGWTAEPPANADAFLIGISGHAKDSLDRIYLHWQYSRWE